MSMTSIKPLLLMIMLTFAWVAHAHANNASRVIDGRYSVQWNNIPIGRITLTALEDADSYFMHVKLRTSGMVRWVKKFKRKVQVEGLIAGEDPLHPHYVPSRYRYSSDYGHKQRSVAMNFVEGDISNITVTPPDDANTRDILSAQDAANAYDPLTMLLTIAAHTQSDMCIASSPCSFRMIDGRRLMEMQLFRDKEMDIEWNGRTVQTARYVGTRIPLKGFSEKELERYNQGEPPLEIYINEDGPRIPLRYAIDTSFGRVSADWNPSSTTSY